MIYSIRGKILERHPTYAVIDTHGVAYQIFISLYTYSHLASAGEVCLLTHLIIKEDGHYLYGFNTESERQLFVQLISVNGVGPNTARLILSSLEPDSIKAAIAGKDELVFRKIKGVGPKTAQRILIDLHDKVAKDGITDALSGSQGSAHRIKSEALSALVALGFARAAVEQVFKDLPELKDPETNLEHLIKAALKKLA
ncbi:MAG: Holliday junction branch migration protein RuvA [Saprospiraceae bacterium]|nr:Holliday junction branch migration protein RuvA [Saprospiraceae bacterium]